MLRSGIVLRSIVIQSLVVVLLVAVWGRLEEDLVRWGAIAVVTASGYRYFVLVDFGSRILPRI